MKQLVGKNFDLVVFDKDRDVFVMFCKYVPGGRRDGPVTTFSALPLNSRAALPI